MQAHILRDSLLAQGIRAEVHGVKDYSSIVAGGDQGHYDLYVEDEKYDQAIASLRIQDISAVSAETQSEEVAQDPDRYYKKAVIFSLLGPIFVPLVFNYVGFINLKLFLKTETSAQKRLNAILIFSVLQIPTLLVILLWYRVALNARS